MEKLKCKDCGNFWVEIQIDFSKSTDDTDRSIEKPLCLNDLKKKVFADKPVCKHRIPVEEQWESYRRVFGDEEYKRNKSLNDFLLKKIEEENDE